MKVRFLPPVLFDFDLILRGSSCWSLHLALNQKFAGSIPVPGAVAVLHWFRNLTVNQVDVGSIPIGHPLTGSRFQAPGFRTYFLKSDS